MLFIVECTLVEKHSEWCVAKFVQLPKRDHTFSLTIHNNNCEFEEGKRYTVELEEYE